MTNALIKDLLKIVRDETIVIDEEMLKAIEAVLDVNNFEKMSENNLIDFIEQAFRVTILPEEIRYSSVAGEMVDKSGKTIYKTTRVYKKKWLIELIQARINMTPLPNTAFINP